MIVSENVGNNVSENTGNNVQAEQKETLSAAKVGERSNKNSKAMPSAKRQVLRHPYLHNVVLLIFLFFTLYPDSIFIESFSGG